MAQEERRLTGMADRDYVLGTEEGEIARLGLQHRVWRPRMLSAFRAAGIRTGLTVADIGCGPGYASLDLAEIVGSEGRVLSFERSRRFLDVLAGKAAARGLRNVEPVERDVSEESLATAVADAAWCRWVLSFVADPGRTVRHIAEALRPGGVAIFHEYADYDCWRTMPPSADLDRFQKLVMQSWRETGGEPDVALSLPGWLAEAGLELVEVSPMIEMVRRGDVFWEWPQAFLTVNAERLRALGYVEAEEAERFAAALDRLPDHAVMITPLVAQVIARKPG